MQYSVEDLSPVKKKVVITTDANEVDLAITAAVAVYRTSVQLDGFRKGKVPASVVEQRFRERIYEEARQDLVNAHINEAIQGMDVSPISGITVNGGDAIERGQELSYSIEFEVLPTFDLPPYEGLEVDQEKVEVKEDEVAQVIDRIRRDRAKLVPVDGAGPAIDGQIANIDFAAFEDGKPVEGIASQGFELALGERQALEDFEALVKTIALGSEGEGEIHFPEDFLSKDLAGKTVTMKITVHAIKERQLPELDDDLAKSLGVETVEKLKENITQSYSQSRESLNRSTAQKTLLDRMLKMVEFPLPESLLETQTRTLLGDLAARLERQGRGLDALGKKPEELREEMRPQAEELARIQVLLLTIAKKEGLEVSDREVNAHLYRSAMQSGEDFKALREQYERSGAMFILRDRLLADKAMDAVYAKAKVTEVEPKPIAPAATDTADTAGATNI